jgi:hypothetical protein
MNMQAEQPVAIAIGDLRDDCGRGGAAGSQRKYPPYTVLGFGGGFQAVAQNKVVCAGVHWWRARRAA